MNVNIVVDYLGSIKIGYENFIPMEIAFNMFPDVILVSYFVQLSLKIVQNMLKLDKREAD
jgi:hypothetical protein